MRVLPSRHSHGVPEEKRVRCRQRTHTTLWSGAASDGHFGFGLVAFGYSVLQYWHGVRSACSCRTQWRLQYSGHSW